MASSIDQNGELRLPSEGSQELFWLAGMSGTHVIPWPWGFPKMITYEKSDFRVESPYT